MLFLFYDQYASLLIYSEKRIDFCVQKNFSPKCCNMSGVALIFFAVFALSCVARELHATPDGVQQYKAMVQDEEACSTFRGLTRNRDATRR
jgi:hypothetical protein